METMKMNRNFCFALLLCAAFCAEDTQGQEAVRPVKSTLTGRSHSGPDFEAFIAKEGWVFSADQTKGQGFPDLEGTPSAVEGGMPFSANAFDPEQFDPRLYLISLGDDPKLPTNFNIGDRGVIQFHSAERCQDLYARHLIRQSKGQ
jgi:hypothetical protein